MNKKVKESEVMNLESSPDWKSDKRNSDLEYWDATTGKYENVNVLIRQMKQMKQTIKTLMEINQEQHWQIIELNDEKMYLTRQIRDANHQLQFLESNQEDPMIHKEESAHPEPALNKKPLQDSEYELVRVDPSKGRGGYSNRRQYQPRGNFESLGLQRMGLKKDPLTERIKELMETANSRPLIVPFTFDKFGGSLDASKGSPEKQSQYKSLAALFVDTADANDKPQMQQTMPLIKKLENDLREGICTKNLKLLAETILKIKEKKLSSLIDLSPAEKKLQELLASPITSKDIANKP